MKQTMPSYVVRRRKALYFCTRIGIEHVSVLGKEVVVSLKNG
ncbi:hypothetical protein [Aristophania vespae]|nr:hypothetical protein [Aristophania vespae]